MEPLADVLGDKLQIEEPPCERFRRYTECRGQFTEVFQVRLPNLVCSLLNRCPRHQQSRGKLVRQSLNSLQTCAFAQLASRRRQGIPSEYMKELVRQVVVTPSVGFIPVDENDVQIFQMACRP